MLCKLLFCDRYHQHQFFFLFSIPSSLLFVLFYFFHSEIYKKKKRTKMDEFSTQTVITPRKKNALWFLWYFPLGFIFCCCCCAISNTTNTLQQMPWILIHWIYHRKSVPTHVIPSTNGNQPLQFGFFFCVGVGFSFFYSGCCATSSRKMT